MNKYLKSITDENELVMSGTIDIHEIRKFSISDSRWVFAKMHAHPSVNARIGEVYQINFGKNYKCEMSYEHRGLIIGRKGQLIRALPVFTYDPQKHIDVIHRIDNPAGKSNMYLLKASDYGFVTHDSVVRTDMMCTLSTSRIISKYSDTMSPVCDDYAFILNLVFKYYFPTVDKELNDLKEELRMQLEENQKKDDIIIRLMSALGISKIEEL